MGESFLKRLFKPKEQKVEPAAAPTAEELARLDSTPAEIDQAEIPTDPMQRTESTPSLTVVSEDELATEPAFTAEDMEFFAQGEAGYSESGMLPTYNDVMYQETQKQPSKFSSWLNKGFDTVAKRVNNIFSDKEGNVNETKVHMASFSFGTVGAMAMAAMLSHQMEGFQQNVESYIESLPGYQMQVER